MYDLNPHTQLAMSCIVLCVCSLLRVNMCLSCVCVNYAPIICNKFNLSQMKSAIHGVSCIHFLSYSVQGYYHEYSLKFSHNINCRDVKLSQYHEITSVKTRIKCLERMNVPLIIIYSLYSP